ncbi:hypothetical protein ElyMa_002032900 [Elysia marginata]|uniref:DNA helicase n=1 Tax=Elysia marginata TaxID=1093978 RepID=A0AAV4F6Q3_9GAST|nr:hypothetical protein ElyMa_002032900 [Elysia marginata]
MAGIHSFECKVKSITVLALSSLPLKINIRFCKCISWKAISLTKFGNEVRNIDELIESVYHNFEENHRDAVWLTDRAILTPYNDTVTKINNRLMEKLSWDVMTYT